MKFLKTILSILKHIFFLVLPSAFAYFTFWFTKLCENDRSLRQFLNMRTGTIFNVLCIVFYILTIFIVIFYVKNSWGKAFILPISFILAPIAVYIYEYPASGFLLQYMGTWATAIYYSAPFFVISIICILIKTY